jgi:NAD(P)-dependent dehydrogenase (short-subunit alcohol dehydrogenase family)
MSIVVVTRCSTGIGQATAVSLARAGHVRLHHDKQSRREKIGALDDDGWAGEVRTSLGLDVKPYPSSR